jgi:hypothetical protein
MSQVCAFDVKNTRHLQTQIQAWNYLLGLLRDDGERLTPKSGRDGVSIPRNVDINAVFTAPVTADGEGQFEIATDGWRRLGVEMVSSSDSESTIEEAERLLSTSSFL